MTLSHDTCDQALEKLKELRHKIIKMSDTSDLCLPSLLSNTANIDPLVFTVDINNAYIASRINNDRKHLWHVSAPKTGSTWLTSLIINLLGWRANALVNGYERREQELDLRPLLHDPNSNLFSVYQHCAFSGATEEAINLFKIKVVLQGRNLFDSLVSLREHLLKESTVSPIAFVEDFFFYLSPKNQFNYLIDFAVPWYLRFYASWFSAKKQGRVEFLWVDYGDLLADSAGVLAKILAYLDESKDIDTIQHVIETVQLMNTRKNKAVTGRGGDLLSASQKKKIYRLAEYYSYLDFSPIGL